MKSDYQCPIVNTWAQGPSVKEPFENSSFKERTCEIFIR